MKACIVSAKGVLEIWDIPIPKLGAYDVLCKIVYGATCGGTDIHLMDGEHPTREIPFPSILGHESIGRVIDVGCKVKNYKEGDLITRVGCPCIPEKSLYSSWGGFAEYGVAKDHWQMRLDGVKRQDWDSYRVNQIIHPSIDEKDAPMIITWRETLSYDRRIGMHKGQRVLVIGSGANALAHCVHACNMSAIVIVIGSSRNRHIFEKLSIEEYLDYRSPDLEGLVQGCIENEKFDLIIDAVGASAIVNTMLSFLKQDGKLGIYGWNGRKNYSINPFNAGNTFTLYSDGYDEEESHAEVQSLIMQGKLSASMWYDKENVFSLDDIAKAYEMLRRHDALKYLIKL